MTLDEALVILNGPGNMGRDVKQMKEALARGDYPSENDIQTAVDVALRNPVWINKEYDPVDIVKAGFTLREYVKYRQGF